MNILVSLSECETDENNLMFSSFVSRLFVAVVKKLLGRIRKRDFSQSLSEIIFVIVS